MARTPRVRWNRTTPRLLRHTDGDTPATAVHAPPPAEASHEGSAGGGVFFEYDDGNGLWITSGETPSDLG